MRHAFSTEQEYTVEAILDSKITKTKKGNLEKSFLIKWDGCDEQSWEPTKNLTGCEEMLNAYMNRISPITSPDSSDTEGDTIHATLDTHHNTVLPLCFVGIHEKQQFDH